MHTEKKSTLYARNRRARLKAAGYRTIVVEIPPELDARLKKVLKPYQPHNGIFDGYALRNFLMDYTGLKAR